MERLMNFMRTDRAKLIICLLIAAIIWFINEMSKNYQTEFSFEVVYQYPEQYLPAEKPPSSIKVNLSGEGWKLMRKSFNGMRDSIIIDIHGSGSYYVDAQDLSFKISNAVQSDELQLSQIRQDGFNINLVPRIERRVPIKEQVEFNIPDQYGIVDSLSLSPDSAILAGPSSMIEDLKYWNTKTTDLGELEGSVNKPIPLEEPGNDLVQVSPEQTILNIKTELFTEQSFFVPLSHDKESEREYMIFPEEVQVRFEVGMSRYEQIKPSDFSFQLEKISPVDDEKSFRVSLESIPSGIRNVSYRPKEVELFYIESDTMSAENKGMPQ